MFERINPLRKTENIHLVFYFTIYTVGSSLKLLVFPEKWKLNKKKKEQNLSNCIIAQCDTISINIETKDKKITGEKK